MNIVIEPGVYVAAVSGGVDSMVLLDLLRHKPEVHTVVAHFDHGIRPDSGLDRHLVQDYATKYGLAFVFDQAELGPDTSEAKARDARYAFLRRVQAAAGAKAIVTAHHQDDLIETALINLLRGTHHRGLSSLESKQDILRPLLDIPKKELVKYAGRHKLKWREDSTNAKTDYLRNRLRLEVIPRLTNPQRHHFLELLQDARHTKKGIDQEIANLSQFIEIGNTLNREVFTTLPHSVAKEIMAGWLRRNNAGEFNTRLLEKLVVGAKSLTPGKVLDVSQSHVIAVEKDSLALYVRDR